MITDSGEHEGIKLAVHGSILGLAVLCIGYNLTAYYRRKEGHLARNVGIYGSLAVFEVAVMAHHCGTDVGS